MCPRCHTPQAGCHLLPILGAVVEDGGPPLCRYQATKAMGYWAGGDEVYAFLLQCLASPERLVRLGAVESLRLANRREVGLILAAHALEESDDEVLQALNCNEEHHARYLS